MGENDPVVSEVQPQPEASAAPVSAAPGLDASLTETSVRLTAAFASLRGELEALHAATAQQETRSAELDLREAALRDHASQLTDREHHLAEGHKELNEARERLLAEASVWRARETAMADRERALGDREKSIGEREAKALGPLQRWKQRLEIRRRRLIKQRSLLAERASQLVRAKEALSQRLADSARMRALTGTMTATPAAENAPQRTDQKASATGALFGRFAGGAGGILALILGASWWLAGVLDEPVYLAQTRLKMENAAEARDDAVDSWTRYHEDLSVDPQMLEEVAERLKKRGDPELVNPTAVRRLIEDRLVIDSPERGHLTLTLTGEGRLRTQRTLETYTAALVGHANDTRDRRLDRSSTVVAAAASTPELPAGSGRVQLFLFTAAVMLALTVTAGLGGVGLMTRPRTPKEKPAAREDDGEERWTVDAR